MAAIEGKTSLILENLEVFGRGFEDAWSPSLTPLGQTQNAEEN